MTGPTPPYTHGAAKIALNALQKRYPDEVIALAVNQAGRVLGWCRASLLSLQPGPNSLGISGLPVVRLIQHIIERPDFRNHSAPRIAIYTTDEPTQACIGMMFMSPIQRLVFTRGTEDRCVLSGALESIAHPDDFFVGGFHPANPHHLEVRDGIVGHPQFKFQGTPPGALTSIRIGVYMAVTMAIASLMGRGGFLPGRVVSAILVGEDGAILTFGVNTGDDNYTLHAECNCLFSYHLLWRDRPLKAGTTMFTSLESCPRCAGAFTTAMAPGCRVYFARPDDKLRGTRTALRENDNNCEQQHKHWGNEPAGTDRFAPPKPGKPPHWANFPPTIALPPASSTSIPSSSSDSPLLIAPSIPLESKSNLRTTPSASPSPSLSRGPAKVPSPSLSSPALPTGGRGGPPPSSLSSPALPLTSVARMPPPVKAPTIALPPHPVLDPAQADSLGELYRLGGMLQQALLGVNTLPAYAGVTLADYQTWHYCWSYMQDFIRFQDRLIAALNASSSTTTSSTSTASSSSSSGTT